MSIKKHETPKEQCEPVAQERCPSCGLLREKCERRRLKFYSFLTQQAGRYSTHQTRQARIHRKSLMGSCDPYLHAIALAKGVIVTVVERFSGRPGQTDKSISARLLQSAAFIQGMGLCEAAIEEALYAQAGALVRQEMESIAAMEESKLGKRKDNATPNVQHVPPALRRAYGQLAR